MLHLFLDAAKRWAEDKAPVIGAALAYYTVFSLGPVLMIVLGVAGLAFGEEAVRGELYGQLAELVGTQGGEAIQKLVEGASSKSEGLLASLLAPILFLFGATAVFAQLQGALNRIWRTQGPDADDVAPAKPAEQASAVRHVTRIALAFVRIRLVSFGLVIGGGFLLTVSLAVNAVIVGLSKSWNGEVQALAPLLWVVQLAVSIGALTGLFAAIYKRLPDTPVDWIDVWTGGLITAVLFTAGKFAIGAYLASTDVASSYGAAGTIILILLWVYYSAQIFLYGAEITWLWWQRRNARRH